MSYLKNTRWFQHPTKQNLVIATLVWLLIVLAIIIDKTDMFSHRLPFTKNFFPYLLILISADFMYRFYRNYFKEWEGDRQFMNCCVCGFPREVGYSIFLFLICFTFCERNESLPAKHLAYYTLIGSRLSKMAIHSWIAIFCFEVNIGLYDYSLISL